MRPERLKVGRNQFVEILRERGVGMLRALHPAAHDALSISALTATATAIFRSTEDIFSRCLSLPIYAAMTDDDVAYVIETVRAIVRENSR